MDLKRIRLAVGELSYLELGDGPDLLFLHGAIATAEAYIPLLGLLSKTYHVIAPVHPGHGRSFPIPRDWKLNDLTRFYQDFLIELNIAPEFVVGHSFGGTLALLLALAGVGKRIILMDSPGLPFDLDLQKFARALLEEGREMFEKRRKDPVALLEATKAAGTLAQTVAYHPGVPMLFTKLGSKFDIYRELGKLTIPVDILWGELDEVVPLAIGQKMKEFIPHARFTMLPGRRHNYSVTDPEFTYKELLKVIGHITPPSMSQ